MIGYVGNTGVQASTLLTAITAISAILLVAVTEDTASRSGEGGIALDIKELGGRPEGPFATAGMPDTGSIIIGEG